MKLPPRIKVGYRTYRVDVWPPLEAVGANRYGECNHMSGVIRIDVSHGPLQTAETLLHEVLHAAWRVSHLERGDEEERIVGTLGASLTGIWRDNPGLLEWFSEAIRAEGAS